MTLGKAMEKLKWDTRLIEIELAKGTLSKEEYQKHLAQLADDSANVDVVSFEDENLGEDAEDRH